MSKDEYPWNEEKELDLLMRFDEYFSEHNRWPPTKILEVWAADFTEKYGGRTCTVAMLKSKRQRFRKEYATWFDLQHRIGLGYDPATDMVNCPDHVWKDFTNRHLEATSRLHYKGLLHKDIMIRLFGSTHSAGMFSFASALMPTSSYCDVGSQMSVDISQIRGQAGDKGASQDLDHINGSGDGSPKGKEKYAKRKQKASNDEKLTSAICDFASFLSSRSRKSQKSEEFQDIFSCCATYLRQLGMPTADRLRVMHYFREYKEFAREFLKEDEDMKQAIIEEALQGGPPKQ